MLSVQNLDIEVKKILPRDGPPAEEVEKCAGVCSDEIEKYKEKL